MSAANGAAAKESSRLRLRRAGRHRRRRPDRRTGRPIGRRRRPRRLTPAPAHAADRKAASTAAPSMPAGQPGPTTASPAEDKQESASKPDQPATADALGRGRNSRAARPMPPLRTTASAKDVRRTRNAVQLVAACADRRTSRRAPAACVTPTRRPHRLARQPHQTPGRPDAGNPRPLKILVDGPDIRTIPTKTFTGRVGRRRGRMSATRTARAVVIGTGRDQTDRADRAADDLPGELPGEQVADVTTTGGDQKQQRQRRAGVREHDGVDRRRDVGPADSGRGPVDVEARSGRSGEELGDRSSPEGDGEGRRGHPARLMMMPADQ